MTAAKKNLYAKLAEVTEAIGRVPKNGRNEFHKYDYVREEDLVEAVRGELSKRKIILLPSAPEVDREGTLTTVRVEFTFVDAEANGAGPHDHTVVFYGTGEDKGDKGLYKAYTGALKYCLMKTFLIPTGDDPEGDENTDKRASEPDKPKEPKRATKAQVERLTKLTEPLDPSFVTAKLREIGVDSFEKLTHANAQAFEAWAKEQADG